MLKTILGIIIGMLVGIFLIVIIQSLGHMLFGIADPGIDLENAEQVKEMLQDMPLGALLFVPLSYAVGSFGAGVIATLISEKRYKHWPAIISGSILLIFGIVNLFELPHPAWLAVIIVAVFLPSAYFGYKVLRR